MITVYRIQDDEGRGPWRPGFSRLWVERRPEHDLLLPWVTEFGTEAVNARHLSDPSCFMGCACLSVEQLRRWFTASEYITLRGFGFRAVVMMADELLHSSDTQAVIVRRKPFSDDVRPIPLYGPNTYPRA